MGNYCQINMVDFIISGTEQTVLKAGRSSEVGYQAAKAAKELKRNVEVACLLNGAGANAGATGTARVTAGFPGWIKIENRINFRVSCSIYFPLFCYKRAILHCNFVQGFLFLLKF